jgi:tRNA threonylcarbamoyladenosine biosynthesis protein TsaE
LQRWLAGIFARPPRCRKNHTGARFSALYHLDLYRLADAEELEWIGIRDLFEDESICLVEWPERGAGILPEADLHVYLQAEGSGRQVRVEAASPRGEQLLRNFSLHEKPDT